MRIIPLFPTFSSWPENKREGMKRVKRKKDKKISTNPSSSPATCAEVGEVQKGHQRGKEGGRREGFAQA